MTPTTLQPPSAVSPKSAAVAPLPNTSSASFPVPEGFLSFAELLRLHNLVATSTEQAHKITENLSKVTKQDKKEGMKLLLEVDSKVIDGLDQFIPKIERIARQLEEKLKSNGRVFFVGSGSSGRVGIDIAARLGEAFPHFADKIRGVIAGGDSTMMRAKEKFEDSEEAGAEALKSYELTSNDTVILISASGSAKFNVGCGNFAANAKADVFYFYNSENIPDRTKALFNRDDKKITPLCIDIGAQAIAGSTRLSTATLAQCCLGALVASALYRAQGKNEQAEAYPELLKKQPKNNFTLDRRAI